MGFVLWRCEETEMQALATWSCTTSGLQRIRLHLWELGHLEQMCRQAHFVRIEYGIGWDQTDSTMAIHAMKGLSL